jgi:hypothetical protein
MGLRDNAIVAYAETKVMKKSDRDVWVLAGEVLESLLDKTGFEKAEIDGLVMSGLTGTGGASMFWAQSTCDMLGLEVLRHARARSGFLRTGTHRRLLGDRSSGARRRCD